MLDGWAVRVAGDARVTDEPGDVALDAQGVWKWELRQLQVPPVG